VVFRFSHEKEQVMRKNRVLISILVAALGSGVAMAKGPAGGTNGGMGGSGMGSSGPGMGAGSMNQGQKGASGQANKGQSANEAALQEQERLRERKRLQQQDGSGSADNAPFRTRSEEQIRLQQNLQP
jgi:hypothetical protein